ncbi:MAG: phasin family protein [Holosporales bacterium]|nr:phasin family protein [Holosporales bacterium]
MYRKNMETLASMGKTSMDVYQNLAKLQMGFFQQMMADMNQSFQKSLASKNISECVAKGSEFIKDRFSKTMAHAKNISNELSSGGTQVSSIAKDHAKEQMQTLKEKLKQPK